MVSSNSPKKRTNEFVVVVKTISFVHFWRIRRYQKSFRNYLTFSRRMDMLCTRCRTNFIFLDKSVQHVQICSRCAPYQSFLILCKSTYYIIWRQRHLSKWTVNQQITNKEHRWQHAALTICRAFVLNNIRVHKLKSVLLFVT